MKAYEAHCPTSPAVDRLRVFDLVIAGSFVILNLFIIIVELDTVTVDSAAVGTALVGQASSELSC